MLTSDAGHGPGAQVDAVDLLPARAAGAHAAATTIVLPASAPGATRPVPPTTYVVQPGETPWQIATRLGVNAAQLATANKLVDASTVDAGQALVIPDARDAGVTAPALPVLPAGGPLAHAQFWPWPPSQGQTTIMWWRASASTSGITLTLGGRPVPVFGEGGPGGASGWALLPVKSLAEPGMTRLVVSDLGRPVSMTLELPIVAGVYTRDDVPPEAADPILAEAQRVAAETARTTAIFSVVSPFGWGPTSRFRSPLEGDFPHTSPFGSRRAYGSSTVVSVHDGEDYGAPAGTPVLAPAPGVVVLAEPLFVRGNAVIIDHGHGVFTGYWHMSMLAVKAGDQVSTGQKLGEVGTTGLSTGPHLHWELRVDGTAAAALQWLAP